MDQLYIQMYDSIIRGIPSIICVFFHFAQNNLAISTNGCRIITGQEQEAECTTRKPIGCQTLELELNTGVNPRQNLSM